jgi:hypothetical protein
MLLQLSSTQLFPDRRLALQVVTKIMSIMIRDVNKLEPRRA